MPLSGAATPEGRRGLVRAGGADPFGLRLR